MRLALALLTVVGCRGLARPAPPPREPQRLRPDAIQVAVTVDDLPAHGPPLPGAGRLAVVETLLAAFAAHKLPAVHGFVNGKLVNDDPALEVVLRRWVAAGQQLGNHSWSHPSLNSTSLDAYLADIRRNEDILDRVAPRRRLEGVPVSLPAAGRHDGETRRRPAVSGAGRLHRRRGHHRRRRLGLQPPFVRCAERRDQASLAALRRSFVDGHVEELRRIRAITRTLAGRDVPQVLLLHAGVADAEFIDALLTAFEAEGAQWVGLRAALADPFYARRRTRRFGPDWRCPTSWVASAASRSTRPSGRAAWKPR